jgi:hypothetical protein
MSAAISRAVPARPAPEPAAAGVLAGVVMVQLASMDSEAQARLEWERLSRRYGALLNGRQPSISKFDRNDGKIFWRLRTGGFADPQQAASFCAELKAKGGACAIAHT